MAETLTKDQAAEARKVAAQQKKQAEQKEAQVKKDEAVHAALVRAEMAVDTELTPEQRDRAADDKKKGLHKKALQEWIMEGKDSRSAQTRGSAKKGGTRAPRASKNPEAKALADAAAARAPEVKSAFLPKDAEAFTKEILKGRKAADLLVGGIPAAEEGKDAKDISVQRLTKFAVKGEPDTEVRAFLRDLGKGTRLWGRKLGLFLVEQIARDKK